jgi:hypothetical protein
LTYFSSFFEFSASFAQIDALRREKNERKVKQVSCFTDFFAFVFGFE